MSGLVERLRAKVWIAALLGAWAFIGFGLYCASQNMAREHAYHVRCDTLSAARGEAGK